MKTNRINKLLLVCLLPFAGSFPAFAQGTAFSYQGRLNSGGTPANGFFDITFSVWNASSGPAQVGGTITSNAVPVSNGLFTVTLDFGTSVFTGADRWLEISVRTNGGGGFNPLTPRQKLTATPYAITSGNLTGSLGAAALPTGGNWALNSTLTLDSGTLAIDPINNRVGIGTASPSRPLEIRDAQASARIASSLLSGAELDLTTSHEDPSTLGAVTFSYADTVYGRVDYGWGGLQFVAGQQPRMRIGSDGNVGIGTTSPSWPLHVVAAQSVARLDSTANGFGSVIELRNNTASPTTLGAINFNNAAATYPGQIAYTGTDALAFRTAGAERMRLDNTGRLDVTAAGSAVNLNANGFAGTFTGALRVTGDSSHSKPFLQIHETEDGDYARIQLQVANRPLWHISVGGAANSVVFYNSSNSIVTSISESGVLTTKVLTITGGADIAEPFAMSEADLPKGSVVVIDEQRPGQLKLSTEPYDRSVAGIISGAGGVRPGLSLSQQGVMEGDQHVALSGRVYVQADTSNGPIKPGDLLTTSGTPGHAMKVADHARAQGAILGKAMTGLPEGEGLVLVLVTLQ